MMQVGATSISVLRSVWQAYWLYENWNRLGNAFDQLRKSLLEMEDRFEDFIQQLNGSGWDTSQINLKVPREISLDELSPIWVFKYGFCNLFVVSMNKMLICKVQPCWFTDDRTKHQDDIWIHLGGLVLPWGKFYLEKEAEPSSWYFDWNPSAAIIGIAWWRRRVKSRFLVWVSDAAKVGGI